ncbi:GDSL-type esterase/lipase family protein [Paracoccus aminophilus]|uniref:Carboxylesterase n=1 Tax=Paracoccus aminophilus JCM 7686 TaxID=1367847 RepID=S5XQR0_PARAH|nr:GDSL-type esterase/lipase family protein [Paracoccus aminophilus]AGT09729.1 carboxylesterase [Paracoccus aminophilus JCM 7686]
MRFVRALLGFALAAVLAAQALAETPRILAFGDSITEGYGLGPDDGLVPELNRWLKRHGYKADLVNAGLSGDTTYGGRVRIGWSLREGADAVIVELGGNDLIMGWKIRDIEKNLDAIITQAKAKGRPVLLVGITPPEGFTKTSGAAVREMWDRLAARHEVLLLPDLYAPLWAVPLDEARRSLLQKDGVHLSKQGVRLVVTQELGPAVARLIDATRAN